MGVIVAPIPSRWVMASALGSLAGIPNTLRASKSLSIFPNPSALPEPKRAPSSIHFLINSISLEDKGPPSSTGGIKSSAVLGKDTLTKSSLLSASPASRTPPALIPVGVSRARPALGFLSLSFFFAV